MKNFCFWLWTTIFFRLQLMVCSQRDLFTRNITDDPKKEFFFYISKKVSSNADAKAWCERHNGRLATLETFSKQNDFVKLLESKLFKPGLRAGKSLCCCCSDVVYSLKVAKVSLGILVRPLETHAVYDYKQAVLV